MEGQARLRARIPALLSWTPGFPPVAGVNAQIPNRTQSSAERYPTGDSYNPYQKNPSTNLNHQPKVMLDQSCVSYGSSFFDPILNLPRADSAHHSFGSRVDFQAQCIFSAFYHRLRRKRFSVLQIKALTLEKFGPCFSEFLIPQGRWEAGRGMRFPRPPIPSLTTASGISKLNSFAEQAQSIIKDCQATPLDCKSVSGTIFCGT